MTILGRGVYSLSEAAKLTRISCSTKAGRRDRSLDVPRRPSAHRPPKPPRGHLYITRDQSLCQRPPPRDVVGARELVPSHPNRSIRRRLSDVRFTTPGVPPREILTGLNETLEIDIVLNNCWTHRPMWGTGVTIRTKSERGRHAANHGRADDDLCGPTRREVLRIGGLVALRRGDAAPAAPAEARASRRTAGPARARSVILLNLFGGPSHLDMFDLKPDAPAEIRGEFRPIATSVPGPPGLRAPAPDWRAGCTGRR